MTAYTTSLIASIALAAGAEVDSHGKPASSARARFEIAGPWRVVVTMIDPQALPGLKQPVTTLDVAPAAIAQVAGEACGPLPVFNPKAGGWAKGYRLKGIETQETTAFHFLDPASFELRLSPDAGGPPLKSGEDFLIDLDWGTLGRKPDGPLKEGQAVFASYRHGTSRLDAIILTADGQVVLRQGKPHPAAPPVVALGAGERRLANIYVAGRAEKLSIDDLFPVLEPAFPPPLLLEQPIAAKLAPKAYAKLVAGEPVRILAWGDSVTEATYLHDPPRERWQAQFVAAIKAKFPQAKIELITDAWGGRNTDSYLNEPPGALHNYKEKVLAAKPDLVVSEFVNDGGFTREKTMQQYARLLGDFRAIGAEWIILTPHYVLPGWMGLKSQRDCDDDPRAYVKALREFGPANGVAIADGSKRYGRLWRQGVPYMTLMLNAINHPNPVGMKLFADSLMELF
ncbi:MAG: SGNH/GDSL hydrolase family protein [Planctomycetota bacterium]|nr:SGNH/GDSL hydrolase family protein [Planctomycetota bacterium]